MPPQQFFLATCPSGRRAGLVVRRFGSFVLNEVPERGPRRGLVLVCSERRRLPLHSSAYHRAPNQRAPHLALRDTGARRPARKVGLGKILD